MSPIVARMRPLVPASVAARPQRSLRWSAPVGSPPGKPRTRSARGGRSAWAVVAAAAMLALAQPALGNVWPSSHDRVARALGSADLGERRAAAARLLELPSEIAKPLVVVALDDVDTEVRLFAARAAVELGVRGVGPRVVAWLSDPDPRLRVAACGLVDREASAEFVGALGRLMADVVPEVRRAAALALGSTDSTEAVPALLGRLDDAVVSVRLEVVRALERIGDSRAVLPLVSKLQDGDPDVRAAAARALGTLKDAQAVPTLMLALQDSVDAVRDQALAALGDLGADTAVSAIAALLAAGQVASIGDGGNPQTRAAALRTLGRIGSAQAFRLLLTELEREASTNVEQPLERPGPAQQALELGGDRSRALLLETLRTTASSALATGAALALARMGVREAGALVLRAARRGTLNLRVAVAVLGALGDPSVIPQLLEHLDAPDPVLRRAVVEVSTRLLDPSHPDGRVVDPIEPRLTDPRTPLAERVALVALLGRSGSARAGRLLVSLAGQSLPSLQLAIVRALGDLGVASAAVDTILFEALSASSASLRMAAAESLGRVGRDATVLALLERLENAAEQDRGAIGLAVSGALANVEAPSVVARATTLLAVAPERAADALLEGLGRSRLPEAGAALALQARNAAPDDRRKAAEGLGGHFGQVDVLVRLTRDADPTVRANAAWSLGDLHHGPALGRLVDMLGELDVTVAANAARSIGRVAGPGGSATKARGALCGALDDHRSYVRVNALAALRWLGPLCPGNAVQHALQTDRSWRVRRAAADLLWGALAQGADGDPPEPGSAAKEASNTRRALARCAREDRDAAVAERCAAPRAWTAEAAPVLVYVVPHGATVPVARAPYALELADGSLRLGTADRRGAVFERAAAEGPVRLAEPGPLAR